MIFIYFHDNARDDIGQINKAENLPIFLYFLTTISTDIVIFISLLF